MRMSAVLVVLVVVAHAGSAVSAQQNALPAGMVAGFPPAGSGQFIWAEEWRLPVQPSSGFVKARVSFDNSSIADCSLSIRWLYAAAGATVGSSLQTIELSMRPTAVARRTGTTDTIYIVGWSDRTGRVIVESCKFGQYALGAATPPGGGPTLSAFTQPAITRVVEWISEAGSMPPVWDAACQIYGNQLLLLTSGSPTRIHALDLSELTTTVIADATVDPSLEGHRMISVGLHGPDGLMAITERRRSWDEPHVSSDSYLMLRDSDLDGLFEMIAPEQTSTFYVAYPPPWDNLYGEP